MNVSFHLLWNLKIPNTTFKVPIIMVVKLLSFINTSYAITNCEVDKAVKDNEAL